MVVVFCIVCVCVLLRVDCCLSSCNVVVVYYYVKFGVLRFMLLFIVSCVCSLLYDINRVLLFYAYVFALVG